MREFLERISQLDPKRLALLVAQLQSRVDALEKARTEPIAIVGMACRFPGGADTPEEFWRLLQGGVDAIREIPPERWDVDALYYPDPDAPGKMSTRCAGLLERVDLFDAPFFGIAPREAAAMDPQQRLLLELSWEALERAGLSPDRLVGSLTGVFVGISGSDYSQLHLRAGLESVDAYTASGSAHSVAAGRLSFVLGLQGPCFPIDTACSSSLVAVHQAVQSLRAGECRMALAGGVNLILSPATTVALSRSRMMAPDGRCKAFDARADGFVRGEGGAILVLKRLADAEADGDSIVALIRGSAINQDGRSNGLTAPNGPSQEAVIRAALAAGGVEPEQIGYVEAHGTGTSLGDPIEVQALAAVLGRGRGAPLPIGSVKANIGHLESAAGIAGLVKLVLCLQHRQLPPQIHLQQLNPHIPWEELPVTVPTELRAWEAEGTRIGGVSSFGFSGTNAHVVVAEAPERAPQHAAMERPVHLLTLSARSEAALRELAVRYERHLASEEVELADACYSASAGRSHFPHRVTLTAHSREEICSRLRAVAAGERSAARHGHAPAADRPRVAFLFTGQGSQYVGMGRALYETQPTFRAALERCDQILRPYLDPPLLAVLYPAAGEDAETARLLQQTLYTQPALFALEYALAELWRAWGVQPGAVLGHSVGEYAAACVAGVFSLEEGLRLIAERARLMQALPGGGAMAAVFTTEAEIAPLVADHVTRLSIAAVNGPDHVVISGATSAVEAALETLAARGIRAHRLSVSHAFHSPMTNAVLGSFARIAATVSYAAPRIPLVSGLSGRAAIAAEVAAPDHWVRHVRQPVRFAEGMQTLHAAGYTHFLEIGPTPTLLTMGRRCLPPDAGAWHPSLRPGRNDWEPMLASLAALYVAGVEVDWEGFDRDYPRRKVVLPTYPFQRERYWSVPELPWTRTPAQSPSREQRASPPNDGVNELLYEIAWIPVKDAAPADAQSEALHTPPEEIVARVAPRVAELTAANGMPLYDELLPQLDSVAAASVVHALRSLGLGFEVGQSFTAAGIAERLGVAAQHQRLLRRLLVILEEEGVLRPLADGWEVARVPDAQDPAAQWDALRRRCSAFDTELMLVARCAAGLADVLRGAADPLQLLFPGGSLADAERLYQETHVARTYNALVSEVVATAIRDLPAGRPLRVLEIGAGTGGTTSCVLPALPADRTEYRFTDISPRFIGQAKQKFQAYPFVRYQLLDITRDPEAQGFAPHDFDLVIAANVVYATPDLRRTLAHVQRLLASEGLLVLYEATGPQRLSDLTVGLTPGWWAFTDHDLRPEYALLSHRRWCELLTDLGFNGVSTIPDENAAGVLAHQTLVLARAPHVREEGRGKREEPPLSRTRERGLGDEGRPWLIFADATGTGERLAAALRERGDATLVVTAGRGYRAVAADRIEIDPTSRGDFDHLLAEVPAGRWNVVYLWGLDAALREEMDVGELMDQQQRVVGSALHLVQALATTASNAASLWLVTRGAQPVGGAGARISPSQTSLWGLGGTIALEHPELRCIRIDLDPERSDEDETAVLVSQILHAGWREDQIALRGGMPHARRLVRAAGNDWSAATMRFTADASYLITGGLRGLGLRVAEWMVARGARHLLLVGRSEISPSAQNAIQCLEHAGARIRVECGDVACRERLAEIIAEAQATLPPLRGVIHSAGVLDDGVLLQQSWPRFATVMAPKVAGSWNLHTLTRHLPLDFFILFSSGVALLGAGGQGNYAAANAFVDALAYYRRAQGLPALTLNWGAWAEIGAAADHRLAERGTATFTPEQGLRALERALLHASPWGSENGKQPRLQLAVLAADWPKFFASLPPGAEPALLREIAREVRAAAGAQPVPVPTPPLLEQLAGAPPNRRGALLQAHVRGLAAQVLGVGELQRVALGRPLQELGLDSLMAIELRNKLAVALERPLPATLLFEHPTVAALTAHFAADLLSPGDAEAFPADLPATERAAEPIALGEDDLAALLLKKLEHIEAGK